MAQHAMAALAWTLASSAFLTGQRTIRKARHRFRLTLEMLEDRTVSSTFTVNSIGDTGASSGTTGDLRYCITQANSGGNSTTGGEGGGGVSNITFSTTIMNNCTVTGNSAVGGVGGGVDNSGRARLSRHATVRLTNCTVSGNSASEGGGLYNGGAGTNQATLSNCTVSGNSAIAGGGISKEYTERDLQLYPQQQGDDQGWWHQHDRRQRDNESLAGVRNRGNRVPDTCFSRSLNGGKEERGHSREESTGPATRMTANPSQAYLEADCPLLPGEVAWE